MGKELKALKEELAILKRCLTAEQELNRKLNEELMELRLGRLNNGKKN